MANDPTVANDPPAGDHAGMDGGDHGDIDRADRAGIDVNPFCTRRIKPGEIVFEDLAGNQITNDAALWRGTLNLIVGPHGCGKTTLLRSAVDPNDVSWIRMTGISDAIESPRLMWSSRRRIVIDGYERCPFGIRVLWMMFCVLTGRKLLATSHRVLGGHKVVARCGWDPDLAIRLVRHQIEGSSPAIRHAVEAHLAKSIHRRRGEHYRDLFFELYDIVQPMMGVDRGHA